MGDLEWTNDLVIRLMQEYEKRPELWDPRHEMYRVHTLKYESWRELAALFECDIADLRKKLNSLFASHRREKGKVRAGARTNWFLYPYMSFLPTHIDHDTAVTTARDVSTPRIKKIRNPVKEAPPAAVSGGSGGSESEGEEAGAGDAEYEMETEYLQEEEPPPLLLVKQEPATPAAERARRGVKDRAHAKPRLTRPVRRRPRDWDRARDREREREHSTASSLDGRLAEALKLLRRSELTRRKDECDSFGEYIAVSLRKHDERTQSMIKQAINNILFEQEMKKYSANHQYVVISGIGDADENPLILGDDTDK